MVEEATNTAVTAVVRRDSDLAQQVINMDDRVDEVNREMVARMMEIARTEPGRCEEAISMMSVSRHLERIADLTTNIAEDIIFMVEREIVRHNM
jgi:phosphate transport system protein